MKSEVENNGTHMYGKRNTQLITNQFFKASVKQDLITKFEVMLAGYLTMKFILI